MFRGLYEHLLDDKGRLAFPVELRQALDKLANTDSFVLTESLYEPCLVAMTHQDFEEQAEKIRRLPPSNPAVMEFKRVVIASSFVATVDKAGRVSVPKELRSYAGLEREVVWAGMIDKIELWSKTRWDDKQNERLKNAAGLEKLRQILEGYGL